MDSNFQSHLPLDSYTLSFPTADSTADYMIDLAPHILPNGNQVVFTVNMTDISIINPNNMEILERIKLPSKDITPVQLFIDQNMLFLCCDSALFLFKLHPTSGFPQRNFITINCAPGFNFESCQSNKSFLCFVINPQVSIDPSKFYALNGSSDDDDDEPSPFVVCVRMDHVLKLKKSIQVDSLDHIRMTDFHYSEIPYHGFHPNAPLYFSSDIMGVVHYFDTTCFPDICEPKSSVSIEKPILSSIFLQLPKGAKKGHSGLGIHLIVSMESNFGYFDPSVGDLLHLIDRKQVLSRLEAIFSPPSQSHESQNSLIFTSRIHPIQIFPENITQNTNSKGENIQSAIIVFQEPTNNTLFICRLSSLISSTLVITPKLTKICSFSGGHTLSIRKVYQSLKDARIIYSFGRDAKLCRWDLSNPGTIAKPLLKTKLLTKPVFSYKKPPFEQSQHKSSLFLRNGPNLQSRSTSIPQKNNRKT